MARKKSLSEKSVDRDPYIQFDKWYSERLATGIEYPNAFSLATSSVEGSVSVRTVLLKEYNDEGFVFYTNYSSKKGRQISENHKVAMLFFWPEMRRQVRIDGISSRLSAEESFAYFSTRPRESRLGAWASEQSRIIPDREYLEKSLTQYTEQYRGKTVPLPPAWGGYRIIPSWFEFWQEGRHRLHDRVTYTHAESGWIISRLAP